MKLLIASDVHGSPERAEFLCRKAADWQPDTIILLGDLLYHGPRNPLPHGYLPKDVASILGNLPAPVIAVRGNCDAEVDLKVLPFPMHDTALICADHLHILAVHGQHLPPEPPFGMGLKAGMVLLCGHTHIPMARTVAGIHQWNPGSTSLPKHGWLPSYGLYEDGEFRVMSIEGKEILRHRPTREG